MKSSFKMKLAYTEHRYYEPQLLQSFACQLSKSVHNITSFLAYFHCALLI